MDTSEQYIKMCEKAEEIQRSWTKEEGDWYATSVVLHSETEFLRAIHVVYLNKPIEFQFEEFTCWLPRQDQLQEMIVNDPFKGLLNMFFFFSDFFYDEVMVTVGENDIPIEPPKFTSMEQLWLAFVMKEKFDKIWNGTDWTNE